MTVSPANPPASNTTSRARADAWYWLLVPVLFVVQAAYTIGSLDRLWYEEAAEGIRNPFWLDHRLVYDGISSNVGWYGLVLLAYKLFGFSIHVAKYVKLALHLPFLICSAALLKRWIGPHRASIPLLAIGLSPTVLYFNTLGTSYGIDVELAPIVLLLIVLAADRARAGAPRLAVLQFAAGFVAMSACLAFPSFLFYLPVLLAFHLWATHATLRRGPAAKGMAWMAAGFAAPFCAALLYLKNDRAFLSDPATGGAGVFRGGGNAYTFDAKMVHDAVSRVVHDLFAGGGTYYFTLPHVEFSGTLGLAAAAGILLGLIAGLARKGARTPFLLAAVLCVLSIAGPAFAGGLPGLRRSTGFLSGVYVIVACLCAIPTGSRGFNRAGPWAARAVGIVLVVHHLAVYLPNYRYFTGVNGSVNDLWFSHFGSPDESVRRWALEWALKRTPLNCHMFPTCRYSEIYPAVAGYLKWNGLGEPPVLAIEPGSTHIIQLVPWYWETHTLSH